MTQTAIQFEHVRKNFGSRVVIPDLSFIINQGEFVTILGSSGCGKTTTLKMVNGLLGPNQGQIFISGRKISRLNLVQLRRHIGYVVQQVGLFPHMTVAENIAIVPQMLSWDQQKINQRVDELLKTVRLQPSEYRDRYPNQLSGGQQQRIGVARALAANPPCILFDEPFGALDALTREQLQKEIKQIHSSLVNKTFLLVTHDINEALFLGERVMVMNQGKIEQFDTPAKIIRHPATTFVKRLLETTQQNQSLWRRLND